MISIENQMQGEKVSAQCGAHGPYISTFWTIPILRGTVTSWSGCPVCVREQVRAKRGYGKARFKYAHRPSYEVLTVIDGVETRKVFEG